MSYNIILTDNFKNEAKKLIRKFPSLKDELEELGKILMKNPTFGTPLGNDIYKIRISIKSKGKGKRGGARIITQVKIVKELVYLISIYSKGEKNDISDSEIQEIIKQVQS